MELRSLSQREHGVLRWLSLAHDGRAYISSYWQDTAKALQERGLIELTQDYAMVQARVSPAGICYLAEQDGARHG